MHVSSPSKWFRHVGPLLLLTSLASHAAVRDAVMTGGGPGALVSDVPGATTSPQTFA